MIKNEIGTIESISPQGEIVYAVIRRKGDLANDIEGNIVYINSSICTVDTSYTLIPDENKNLAETLIPLDIGLSIYIAKLESLIGKEVVIYEEDGVIKYASIIELEDTPRIISAKDVAIARKISSNISQIDSSGIKYLKQQGYTANQISSIISETMGNNKLSGRVIKYGDTSVYDAVSKSETASRLDMAKSIAISNNIPSSQLKNKTCHIHIKAFSAKWKLKTK